MLRELSFGPYRFAQTVYELAVTGRGEQAHQTEIQSATKRCDDPDLG